jgi:hypothetical protein
MTRQHNHPDGERAARPGPRLNRRRLAVGTAGLAALLGAGAYLVTDRLVNETEQTAAQDVTVIAPADPAAAPAAPASSGASPAAPIPESSAAPTPQASGSPLSDETVTEILKAREKMEKEGVEVKRPLKKGGAAQAASVEATTEGSLSTGGIVRMVTAKEDLTGQRELAWVSGGIAKYRGVPCSQTVRFSPDSPPEKKDNLLICWRTSAAKSVISIVVDPDGKPSRAKAVTALEKEWRSME